MKLLHKLLLYLFAAAVPVALGGIWLFYSLIHSGIQYEVDEQLSSDLVYLTRQWQQPGQAAGPMGNPRIRISETTIPLQPTFSDTADYDFREKEVIPIRRLTATVKLATQKHPLLYRVTIDQPVGEFDEIARLLSVSITVAFILLLSVLVGLNGWVMGRLWQPFYRLIDQLRSYRLMAPSTGNQPAVQFFSSDTTEFNQLSEALNAMSQTLQAQFVAQREFTDNAAHEMQTPLTAMGHELENLLSTQPLTTEQVSYVERAQDSIRRLVRLNKSLLLLTRIENNQFAGELVEVSNLVTELVQVYEDFARHHHLGWTCCLTPHVTQTMHPYLADVLFSNLLQNAIRHSESGTEIRITLTPDYFEIQNSGPPLPFPQKRLFDRFVKDPARPESTGLGLALVQQIAHSAGMQVQYDFLDTASQHTFRVVFAEGALETVPA